MRKLLAVDLQDRPFPLRDRAILELFYSSGIRLSELTGATLPNLDLPERIIRVTGKGTKTRVVPVNRAACRAIGDYLGLERAKLAGKSCALEIFLSRRGRSISNQMVWINPERDCRCCRNKEDHLAALVAPHHGDRPTKGRRRPSYYSRTARTRKSFHDRDLHTFGC
jgi:site-specific recombinase XerC